MRKFIFVCRLEAFTSGPRLILTVKVTFYSEMIVCIEKEG